VIEIRSGADRACGCPERVSQRSLLRSAERGAVPTGTTGGRTQSDSDQDSPMAMSAHFDRKGGTTMVKLTQRWILDAVPACPWVEPVRRT
jgi:hypothetical protein